MKSATVGTPVKDFIEPPGLEAKKICLDSGLLATPRCIRIRTELFKKDSAPVKTCSLHSGNFSDASQVGSSSSAGAGDLLEMESAPPVAVSTVSNGTTVITTIQPTPIPQSGAEQAYPDEGF
jgi:hypothetical protein